MVAISRHDFALVSIATRHCAKPPRVSPKPSNADWLMLGVEISEASESALELADAYQAHGILSFLKIRDFTWRSSGEGTCFPTKTW